MLFFVLLFVCLFCVFVFVFWRFRITLKVQLMITTVPMYILDHMWLYFHLCPSAILHHNHGLSLAPLVRSCEPFQIT